MSERSTSPYSLQSVVKAVNDNFGLLLIAVALFLGGFVIGSLWTENKMLANGTGGTGVPAAAAPAAAPQEAAPLSDADWAEVTKGGIVIGDENAKVTMVEFTDYQCPFCARHYTQTHNEIMKKYVDTGKVKIVLRDQPLSFHPNAASAAQAVRCAEEQSKGVAMHDALFASQDAWANLTGDAVTAKYKELADTAGITGSRVESCVKAEKYKQAVADDSVLANKVGAGGTPTFFIEKKPVVGAVPFATFEQEFEAVIN